MSRRMLSFEHGPAYTQTADLGQPVIGPVWLEPWPDEPMDEFVDGDPGPTTAYLVDELYLMVGHVVLGRGTPAFAQPHSLRLLDTWRVANSDNVLLHYKNNTL